MQLVLYVMVTSMLVHSASSSCSGRRCRQASVVYNDAIKKDYALIGHSIQEMPLTSVHDCFMKCLDECRCLAIQIKVRENRCELLDEDRLTAPGHFKPKQGTNYYDINQEYSQVSRGQGFMIVLPRVLAAILNSVMPLLLEGDIQRDCCISSGRRGCGITTTDSFVCYTCSDRPNSFKKPVYCQKTRSCCVKKKKRISHV